MLCRKGAVRASRPIRPTSPPVGPWPSSRHPLLRSTISSRSLITGVAQTSSKKRQVRTTAVLTPEERAHSRVVFDRIAGKSPEQASTSVPSPPNQPRLPFKIQSYEDWYQVSQSHVWQGKADPLFSALLKRFGFVSLLVASFPEHDWKIWRFESVPVGWWHDTAHQRAYFEDFFRSRRMHSLADFYKVTTKEIIANHGATLLNLNGHSLYGALARAFPEHRWQPWQFGLVPRNYWSDPTHLRELFDALAVELGITDKSQWYNRLNRKLLAEKVGTRTGILVKFHWNPFKALSAAYPEHQFVPWKVPQAEKHHWAKSENLADLMQWVAQEMGINAQNMEEWYKVSTNTFLDLGIGRVLREYSHSPSNVVMAAFPSHKWLPWKFTYTPQRFWTTSTEGLRNYFDWLKVKLGLSTMDDWYRVTKSVLVRHKGYALLESNKFSLPNALAKAYPEHHFQFWRFKGGPPPRFWQQVAKANDTAILSEYLDFIRRRLELGNDLTAWTRVSLHKQITAGERATLKHFGGLHAVLKLLYPKENWTFESATVPMKKSFQSKLLKTLKQAYPDTTIKEEAQLLQTQWSGPLEVDCYLKDLNIVVEYQGVQHFFDHLLYGQQETQLQIDCTKAITLGLAGLHLVEIPFYTSVPSEALLKQVFHQFK